LFKIGNHTGLYILLTWFMIPIGSLVILYALDARIDNAWQLLFAAILVYLVSFILSSAIKKGTGRSVFRSSRDFATKLILILMKSVIFAFGVVGLLMSSPLKEYTLIVEIEGVTYISFLALQRYVLVYVILFVLMQFLARVPFAG